MQLLSVHGLTTFRWTLDEDLLFAQRAGFNAVGLWRQKLDDFGEERTLELLEESGLAVSCLSWAGGFTGADGRSYQQSIVDGLAAVRTAARVKAHCLVVYAGGQNNHINSHANRLLRQGIDELIMAAELAGDTLALKPMHRECAEDWTFQTDLPSAMEFVANYRSPHLRLVYDSYHFPDLLESPELIQELVPHLALVQLGDARKPHCQDHERCPLGAGRLPVEKTVAALLQAGYNGPIDVELMGSEIETIDNEQLLSDIFQSLVDYTTVKKDAPTPPGRACPGAPPTRGW